VEGCFIEGEAPNEVAALLLTRAARVEIRSRERYSLGMLFRRGLTAQARRAGTLLLNPTSTYANAKNPANITFRMAASPVPSQSPNCLTLSVALFSPFLCEPMWREIKRMVQLNLEVRASTPQESSDIVILAGHSRLQHEPLWEEITLTHYLRRMPGESKGLQVPSFDLPAARA